MKILCLHGMGTSAAILEKQLAPLEHALGPGLEWVAVDGLYEHAAHSAVKGIFAGPYFCYHKTLSAHEQADAHAFLHEVIADDGPFDGILGFSHGASLATSFLLTHKMTKPEEPAPFRFAILFNGSGVVSPDANFCADEFAREESKTEKDSRTKGGARASLQELLAIKRAALRGISKHRLPGKRAQVVDEVLGLLGLSLEAAQMEGWVEEHAATDDKTLDDFPRIIHPMMTDARIDIPTSIIVGKEDALFLCSLVQKRLCTKGRRDFVIHDGGHDIPRVGIALDLAVKSCIRTIDRARLISMGGGNV